MWESFNPLTTTKHGAGCQSWPPCSLHQLWFLQAPQMLTPGACATPQSGCHWYFFSVPPGSVVGGASLYEQLAQ
jgi:hypothetical protein